MKINTIKINTKSKKYKILIGKNILGNLSNFIKSNKINSNKFLIIHDANVPYKFIKKIKSKLKNKFFLKKFYSSEKNKNLNQVNKILDYLFKLNFNRNDCIISLGGGITGDVVGFAASIYKRGINFINIPTTLLAQVDSSIGGKTGVNNTFGKNLVGSFYQPDLVVSDVLALNSLPKRELMCGYGELLKHSMISEEKVFKYLNKNYNKILNLKSPFLEKAIFQSCNVKRNIVQKDEKEKNLRKVLNLGHTFAHAFEATLNYSKNLNHGEAVILGLRSAIKFSYSKKLINKKKMTLIIEHINLINKKLKFKNFFKKKDIPTIIKFMSSDKKNISSKINLILLKDINSPLLNLMYTKNDIKKYLNSEFK